MLANVTAYVAVMTIVILHYNEGIFQTYNMVIIKLSCYYEYENALKNTMQIAAVLFLPIFPLLRGTSCVG